MADNARVPSPELSLYAVDYADTHAGPQDIPSGPYDPRVLAEADEDLEGLVDFLVGQGVTVRRPEVHDHARSFGTPDWSADGESGFCPRDVLLTIGSTVVEAPMVLRTRYFEAHAYRRLLLEYFDSGAGWVAAPKPRLLDAGYAVRPGEGPILNELEPVFDAANVLRIGRDILYLVSRSGNRLGLNWLQRFLGPGYRVHAIEGVYDGTHIDTTIAPIRPGLVVLNPERVRPDQVPAPLAGWDVIWCPPLEDHHPNPATLRGTTWMSMNLLMVNPKLAVVDAAHGQLIKELEAHGVDVAPLPMRQARVLSGGFHCVSLDVRRSGDLEDYTG